MKATTRTTTTIAFIASKTWNIVDLFMMTRGFFMKTKIYLFCFAIMACSKDLSSQVENTLAQAPEILWDVSKNRLKIKQLYNENENFPMYWEASLVNGKFVSIGADVRKGTSMPVDMKQLIMPRGGLNSAVLDARYYTKLNLLWFYFYDSEMLYLDLFGKPGFWKEPKTSIIKNEGDKIFISAWGIECYVVSRSKGMVVGYISNASGDDANSFEVGEFASKNGWLFPVVVYEKREGVYVKRQKIDVNTLEINKPLALSDFTVTIPAGLTVMDEIKKTSYQANRPISSMDVELIDAQLKNLVEKAKAKTK